jgi:hypothetical protein
MRSNTFRDQVMKWMHSRIRFPLFTFCQKTRLNPERENNKDSNILKSDHPQVVINLGNQGIETMQRPEIVIVKKENADTCCGILKSTYLMKWMVASIRKLLSFFKV